METYYHTYVQAEGIWWGGRGIGTSCPYLFLLLLFVWLVGFMFVCFVFFPFFGDMVKVVPRLRDSYCRFLCLFGLSGICDTRGACMDR